jgi:hypothetical protein
MIYQIYLIVLQRNHRYAALVFCIVCSFYKEITATRLRVLFIFISFYKEITATQLRFFALFVRSTKKSPLRGSGFHSFLYRSTKKSPLRGFARCIIHFYFVLQRNHRYAAPVFCMIRSFYQDITATRLWFHSFLFRSTKKSPLRGSGFHSFLYRSTKKSPLRGSAPES